MTNRQLYGLVGRTLGHSFSRSYFTEKFEREAIKADYINFELPEIEVLPGLVASSPGLCGFNVTIPYKQEIIPLLDELDASALMVGAVNVVSVLPGGRLKGYNTDAAAFGESLRRLLGGRPVPEQALVLGTGGASLAVKAALDEIGVHTQFVSRNEGEGRVCYRRLTNDIVARCGIIVNTTPLGLWPHTEDAPAIPYDAIGPSHVCFDLVYNPEPTLFMRLAASRGAAVRGGLEMLRLQADASWRIWQENR